MKKYLLLLVLVLAVRQILAQEVKYAEVRFHADPAGMKKLARAGLPMEEGFHEKDGSWTIVISWNDLEKVRADGFYPETIHADYTKWIHDRNLEDKTEKEASIVSNYQVPAHFEQGTFGGFYTLEEILNELDSMRAFYPQLVSIKAAAGNGNSIEGRPVYYVKISDHPDQDENEPKILYSSLIHAREPIGMQQLFFYMWFLLENYEGKEEIRYLVDNLEMYFVPVVNPDGYEYNRSLDPNGGGAWRKNRRLTGPQRYGIDLNRNFGYQWGYDDEGSSPNPADETYRGTNAFSEPETQIMRDFCVEKQFSIVINFHAYSDFLLYPWCYMAEFTPDSLTEINYSRLLTEKNSYICGLPGQILYLTNGDALDWEYGEQGVKPKAICFTAEIGNQNDGFWPPPSRIIPLAQENMYANLMVARLALRYAIVERQTPYIISCKQGYFKFSFSRYGLDEPADYRVSIIPLDTTLIKSTGPSKLIIHPEKFHTYTDSISFSLAEGITPGTGIQYVLEVDNGLSSSKDTITHYFGTPFYLLEDQCNNMNRWNSTQWNISHLQYNSPDGSITDSPGGNYPPNANFSVTTSDQYDPGDSPVAILEFCIRYFLERGYDYVQVMASNDNGLNWTPLSGRYTREGSSNQTPGQPVYDGNQNNWVKEEILLNSFTGDQIKLRFTIKSDEWLNSDGFYFDDLKISIIDMTTGINQQERNVVAFISGPQPNPADHDVMIQYSIPVFSCADFILCNTQGFPMMKNAVMNDKGEFKLNIQGFSPGIYFYYIRGSFGVTDVKKLLIIP